MGVRTDPQGRNAPVERFEVRTPEAQAEGKTDPKGRNAPLERFEVRTPEAQAAGRRPAFPSNTPNLRGKRADRAAGAAGPNGMRRPGAEDGREHPGASGAA